MGVTSIPKASLWHAQCVVTWQVSCPQVSSRACLPKALPHVAPHLLMALPCWGTLFPEIPCSHVLLLGSAPADLGQRLFSGFFLLSWFQPPWSSLAGGSTSCFRC